ncbi:hypothetical protein ACQBAU_00170 [Propionibacteriaceae bacterium Y2011]
MGIVLPGEVAHLLNMLGFSWPNTDESDVFSKGSEWLSFAQTAAGSAQQAESAAQHVLGTNEGPAMEAFSTAFSSGEDSVQQVVQQISSGSSIVGGCMMVMAGVIIALKIVVITQLVLLAIQIASAIAAAVPTCGASLGWIPVAKIIAGRVIEFAINFALEKLMG